MPNKKPIDAEAVELRETSPGVYEPVNQDCDAAPARSHQRRHSTVRRPPSALEDMERGVQYGFEILRRVGKALNVRL
jgi:hypothetical protein